MGVAYPAYMSFKALETKEDPEDDKQWCVAPVGGAVVTADHANFRLQAHLLGRLLRLHRAGDFH